MNTLLGIPSTIPNGMMPPSPSYRYTPLFVAIQKAFELSSITDISDFPSNKVPFPTLPKFFNERSETKRLPFSGKKSSRWSEDSYTIRTFSLLMNPSGKTFALRLKVEGSQMHIPFSVHIQPFPVESKKISYTFPSGSLVSALWK